MYQETAINEEREREASTRGEGRAQRGKTSRSRRKGDGEEAHGVGSGTKGSSGPSRPHAKSRGERNVELGRRGEDAAARFLDRHGYEIVERNWTCAAGEADIIARDEDAVVFVEVKTRSSCECGFPSEAVNAEKRERYERIAALFLQGYDVVDVPVRFDVVAIVVLDNGRAMIRHRIDAFGSE